MHRTIAPTTICAVLLVLAAMQVAPARASDEASFRKIHHFFEPVGLLPGQSLRICAAHAEKAAMRKLSLYFPESMLVELRLYGMDGAPLITPVARSLEADSLGLCFDVDSSDLGPPGAAPPDAILVDVVVSAHVSTKGFGFVTMETHDPARNLPGALLLPAVQADEPVAPGRFSNYRPQFYLRTTDVGSASTHAFGPFTLAAGQELELCAADAAKVPTETLPLNFSEIVWTAEVYALDGMTPVLTVVAADAGPGSPGTCFDLIRLADLDWTSPDGTQPEAIVVVVLLYASTPAGTQTVPMATGKLKPIIFDEPEPVPLLLPAVQAAREAAR
jgi:hypothetical protein